MGQIARKAEKAPNDRITLISVAQRQFFNDCENRSKARACSAAVTLASEAAQPPWLGVFTVDRHRHAAVWAVH